MGCSTHPDCLAGGAPPWLPTNSCSKALESVLCAHKPPAVLRQHLGLLNHQMMVLLQIEHQLGNLDRCRRLYERYLAWNPANCQAWCRFADLERSLAETDRARALFELAIQQPLLDMPEVLWKVGADPGMWCLMLLWSPGQCDPPGCWADQQPLPVVRPSMQKGHTTRVRGPSRRSGRLWMYRVIAAAMLALLKFLSR